MCSSSCVCWFAFRCKLTPLVSVLQICIALSGNRILAVTFFHIKWKIEIGGGGGEKGKKKNVPFFALGNIA